MVCANNGNELKAVGVEVFDYRRCIARVHDCRMPAIVDDPEIVILERRYRMNNKSRGESHAESVKMKT